VRALFPGRRQTTSGVDFAVGKVITWVPYELFDAFSMPTFSHDESAEHVLPDSMTFP
jgi:hypothetical protein